MSIIINSESDCRRAYLNYHCYGNTMGITAEEMGQITSKWSDKLTSWQNSVSSDETEYEFDDSDYNIYKTKGENAVKNATGYDGKNGGSVAHTVGDVASSVAGAGMTLAGKAGALAGTELAKRASVHAVNAAGDAICEVGTKEVAKQLAAGATEESAALASNAVMEETAQAIGNEAAKDAGKAIGFIVGCTLGAITAASYWIKRPNKEEKEACDALLPEMGTAQSTLSETQDDMANMANEIMDLSDEANKSNEEANLKMAEKKSEYDMYKQTYEVLKVKADSGVALTESEKSLYKNVVVYMEKTGTSIHKISGGTTDKVAEISGEIKGYQSGYDDAASTMAEIEGMTDYAASFDKTTKVMCYVEGGAQTLNAASSAYSAYEAGIFAASGTWAFGVTAWAWAFVALGAAAAFSSGTSAAEQFKWAGQVDQEIDAREVTQDLNLGTTEMYEEELDGFHASIEGIKALELKEPTNVEAPTAMGVQTTSQTNTSKLTQDNKKPIKEETV